jgi:hypothetical protein
MKIIKIKIHDIVVVQMYEIMNFQMNFQSNYLIFCSQNFIDMYILEKSFKLKFSFFM